MTFSRNVDNGPSNGKVNFGDVPAEDFDYLTSMDQSQGALIINQLPMLCNFVLVLLILYTGVSYNI